MITAIKLVAAAAAMSSVLLALAAHDAEPPQEPAGALSDRWPPDAPPAPKADRLTPAAAATPLPAATELPAQRVAVAVVIKHAHAQQRPRVRNVCARHGMRKVHTHNGRSWRCRR